MDLLDNIQPFVSVIIPCYNSEKGIKNTLESLSEQDYPKNRWEVIVVDNNSTDTSKSAISSFKNIIPYLSLYNETKQSSYAARNKGIQKSRGNIIAFIDADMIVEPEWIRKGVYYSSLKNADYIGCRVDIFSLNDPPNVFERYEQRTGFPIKSYMEKKGFAGAGCLFVKKKIFDSIGFFDDRLTSGGDCEFGNRVRDHGFKMYYCNENVMLHPGRATLSSYIKKYSRVAKGIIDLKTLYPERYGRSSAFNILLSGCYPFVRSPFFFKNMELLEHIKMLLLEAVVKYTMVYSKFTYHCRIRIRSIFN